MMILFLVFMLLLSFLGINLITGAGNFLDNITAIFGPFIVNILSMFGYTTGAVLGSSASVIGDTTQTGIEMVEGTATSLTEVVRDYTVDGVDPDSADRLNRAFKPSDNKFRWYHARDPPAPNSKDATAIGNASSSSSNKRGGWCLVGEYQGKHGCMEVSESDRCLSQQVFPTQDACLAVPSNPAAQLPPNVAIDPNTAYRMPPVPSPPPLGTGSFYPPVMPQNAFRTTGGMGAYDPFQQNLHNAMNNRPSIPSTMYSTSTIASTDAITTPAISNNDLILKRNQALANSAGKA